MFRPCKAIIRQHIYEEFYSTAHYSNIFFSYVNVIHKVCCFERKIYSEKSEVEQKLDFSQYI
jgi:hypothetical protein